MTTGSPPSGGDRESELRERVEALIGEVGITRDEQTVAPEVIALVRYCVANEIRDANRAARFGITGEQAVQVALGKDPSTPTRPARGA